MGSGLACTPHLELSPSLRPCYETTSMFASPGAGPQAAQPPWPSRKGHFPVFLWNQRNLLWPVLLQTTARKLREKVGSPAERSLGPAAGFRIFPRWPVGKRAVRHVALSLAMIEDRGLLPACLVPETVPLPPSFSVNLYKVTGQFPWSSLRETDRGLSAEYSVSSQGSWEVAGGAWDSSSLAKRGWGFRCPQWYCPSLPSGVRISVPPAEMCCLGWLPKAPVWLPGATGTFVRALVSSSLF